MSDAPAQPLWLGLPERPLLGFYHPGRAGNAARPCAVVLCYPFGHEYTAVYQAYRQLAEQLAAAGFPTLRFDYDGTGDSAGGDGDPDRLRAWVGSIGAAIDKVMALSGAPTVSLIGLRLGATLAYLAAAQHQSVSSLVLWAPSLTGKSYVREWKALRLLRDGGSAASRPPAAGGEEAAGFLMTRQTLDELSRVDLFASPVPSIKQVLLLARDAPLPEKRLAEHLVARGVAVDYRFIPGYATLLVEPYNAVTPDAVFAEIIASLAAAHPLAELAAGVPAAPLPMDLQARFDLHLQHAPVENSLRESIQESVVRFGTKDALLGILSEPSPQRPGGARPALLLLNTSVIHRVGANRMYVPMARRWAAAGFAVFRIDLSGLGDSPLAGFRARQRMYAKDGIQDVRAAMDYLAASRGTTKFILIGLCSGAYMAFHTGLEDSRVVAQVMLNPQTFEWREGDSVDVGRKLEYKSSRFYLRAALQRATWSRLFQGQIHWQGILRTLTERILKNAKATLHTRVIAVIENRITENRTWSKFKKLLERNTQLYLIYSQEDPGLDEFALQLGREVRRLASYRSFKMELIDGPDHTFTPLWSQERVADMITAYVMNFGAA